MRTQIAAGFLMDLGRPLPVPGPGVALVLGAGGSARAVVYALVQRRLAGDSIGPPP